MHVNNNKTDFLPKSESLKQRSARFHSIYVIMNGIKKLKKLIYIITIAWGSPRSGIFGSYLISD
jgi:hypothetical protein